MSEKIGPRQTPEKGTDLRFRRLYVLKGNTGNVAIGTCEVNEISDILKSTFRDNGMVETDYFLSMPVKNSAYPLEELRSFCRENGKELAPSLYQIDYAAVALKANELVPGGFF